MGGKNMNVAVLGNHDASYCTESDLSWTLGSLGLGVLRLQENRTRTEDILRLCAGQKVTALIYLHTHTWTTPGQFDLDELWKRLNAMGVVTVGFHLDRYWGLNIADHREDLIGKHPFWHCKYIFTADGGNQERFQSRNVNHFWLPPGVVQRDCYKGNAQPDFLHDVIFVGQRAYHREYPFRGQLIAWLEQTYRERFKLYPGNGPAIREGKLNNLYASAKVVVGDTCFAGDAPYFWSDRLPETTGRHGFLIHPLIEGMTIPVATYEPKNLNKLKELIDYYVSHDEERTVMQDMVTRHVMMNDTYTHRMRELFSVIGQPLPQTKEA